MSGMVTQNIIPLPSLSLNQKIPLSAFDWDKFEAFCEDLFAYEKGLNGTVHRYGRQGQTQFGIDILSTEDNITVWQVKHYAKFTESDLKTAVGEFLAGKWKDIAKCFYICIAHPVNDTKLSDEILKQTCILRKEGIAFGVYDSNYLHSIAIKYPQIIQDYLGKPWIDVLGLSDKLQSIADKIHFKKKLYLQPDNYIPMKVGRHPVETDLFSRLLSKNIGEQLIDVELQESKVVLLAGAGCGKSKQLENLAFLLSQDSHDFYPVLITLNTYIDQDIETLVSNNYDGINFELMPKDKLVLIFDGFDELTSDDNARTTFIKRIRDFASIYNYIKIIISSRENFYVKSSEDDNLSGTLINFKEYGIYPFTNNDANEYLISVLNQNKYNKFIQEVNTKKLKQLYTIPFYLVRLMKRFEKDGSLPEMAKVMDILVDDRFNFDSSKYSLIELKEYSYRINENLRQLAFAMQLLQRNYLSNSEYQQLINKDDQDLLKCNGIWCKTTENNWQFEHNNFREYLAAKFMSNFELDSIINYIAYKEIDQYKVLPNCINTATFLISMKKEDDFRDWIIENAPQIIINSEPDKLDKETRIRLFKKIINTLKENNTWFNDNYFNEYDLVHFGKCDETLEYLLYEIEDRKNRSVEQFKILRICISMLSHFGELENNSKDKVKEVLIDFCVDESVRDYEKARAIRTLADLKLYEDDNVTLKIAAIFLDSEEQCIINDLHYYFYISNNQDKYVGYFLSNLNRIGDVDYFYLINGLKNITSYDALVEVFDFFAQKTDYHITEKDEIFACACSHASELYKSNKDILKSVLTVFEQALIHYYSSQIESMKAFFINTDTVEKMLNYIIQIDNNYFITQIRDMLNNKHVVYLKDMYIADKFNNKYAFITYVERMPQDSEYFEEFSALIKEKDNITIRIFEHLDYDKLRKEGNQKYFDSLFDKNDYLNLVDELIVIAEKPDLTIEELIHIDFKRTEKRYVLDRIKYRVYRRYKEKDKKVSEIISDINSQRWERISIHEIYNVLVNQEKRFPVEISSSQVLYIKDFCDSKICEIDFNIAYQYKNDNTITYYFEHLVVAFFMMYFKFNCSDDKLLDMLMIPPLLFSYDNKLSLTSYINEKVSDKILIKKRVEYNIEHRELKSDVYIAHIEFCKEIESKAAINLAVAVCKNAQADDYCKQVSLDYLHQVCSKMYLYQKLMPYSDDMLMLKIADKFMQYRDDELITEIIKRYKQQSDYSQNNRYLFILIKMNNSFGVNQLLEILKRDKKAETDSMHNSAISSLSDIDNIDLLPHLIELAKLLFSDDFQDASSSGLYGYLMKAFECVAQSSNNKQSVIKMLNELLDLNMENLNFRCFCNTLLQNLDLINTPSDISRYSIKEVKKIILDLSI